MIQTHHSGALERAGHRGGGIFFPDINLNTELGVTVSTTEVRADFAQVALRLEVPRRMGELTRPSTRKKPRNLKKKGTPGPRRGHTRGLRFLNGFPAQFLGPLGPLVAHGLSPTALLSEDRLELANSLDLWDGHWGNHQ